MVKVCAKGDITVFWSCPILSDVLTVCQIFVQNYLKNWKSSNTEACVEKLSEILVNNIDHGGMGDWSQDLCEVLSKKINEK